jgi:hypothetical protein
MASAITQGWEGLTLKVCNNPYLSLHEDVRQIKLKEDDILELGDSADLVVVRCRRDAKDVQELRTNLRTFLVGQDLIARTMKHTPMKPKRYIKINLMTSRKRKMETATTLCSGKTGSCPDATLITS